MDAEQLSAEDEAVIRELVEHLARNPQIASLLEHEDFDERLKKGVADALREAGDSLLETLQEGAPEMLAEHREHRAAFEADLLALWGPAFDLYETFHVCCKEAGVDFFERYMPESDQPHDFVFDALMRLHGRACLVANEVLTLLRAGFPSGAHSRWRTLHELAVVAFFVTEHGLEIAQRYLAHDIIQRHKSAVIYAQYHERLGYEPLDPTDFAAIEQAYHEALDEFGPGFGKEWGWAIPALPEGSQPVFRTIEEAVHLDHLRPYFRMASDPSHANAHGSFTDLGLKDPTGILIGPSPFGFADPGHGACLSLFQVTVCVLSYKIDMRGAMTLNALSKMLNGAGDVFLDAQGKTEVALEKGHWESDASQRRQRE
ncbi:MAG TPA: DUF5677 domain-containing protein [Fimbriimonadaceae bacterium]|nr:DUF5677 domain-containing protein [Fimbriimonadaceae bacterium]